MKIAILAAGIPKGFPLLIAKPKCLYNFGGEVQLERVINVANKFVDENDIILVGGYKYKLLKNYIRKHHPKIEFRVNNNYKQSAIYSLRKAVEGINDDMVFMLGDENIHEKNVGKICNSTRKMAILCEPTYYYYSVGIMKLNKESLHIIEDDRYLSMDYMKTVYCFAHNKTEYDGNFQIWSGVCLGYTTIDIVRRIGKIDKIEDPVKFYHGNDIDFIPYNTKTEYIPDIDHFYDTDDYKNNAFLRFYSDVFSDGLKKLRRKILGIKN